MTDIILENKLITLNSAYSQKLNGTLNSSVLFNFKGILVEEDDIINSNICVMNAQIPVSFYTINDSNNLIKLRVGVGVYPFTLINGNYNFNTLASMVSSVVSPIIGSGNLSLSINKSTGVITFTSLNVIYYNFDNSYKIFGFLPNVNYNGPTITAPFPCNLLGVKKLSILSQKLQIGSYSSVNTGLGITLSTIPVDQPAFGMISYVNQIELNKAVLQTRYIDQIDISIVDEDNNLINFNGLDWNITLVLENVRRLSDVIIPKFDKLLSKPEIPIPLTTNPLSKNGEGPRNPSLSENIKDLELLNA